MGVDGMLVIAGTRQGSCQLPGVNSSFIYLNPIKK